MILLLKALMQIFKNLFFIDFGQYFSRWAPVPETLLGECVCCMHLTLRTSRHFPTAFHSFLDPTSCIFMQKEDLLTCGVFLVSFYSKTEAVTHHRIVFRRHQRLRLRPLWRDTQPPFVTVKKEKKKLAQYSLELLPRGSAHFTKGTPEASLGVTNARSEQKGEVRSKLKDTSSAGLGRRRVAAL